ncbi:hypothetical protein EDB87DRAFT_505793 [Lactarius vividus]|nr:hypothetical protein EDB87DRAFT_505793 [Lactarius vividus]
MPIREHAEGTSGILRKVLMIIPCMNRRDVRILRRITKITQLDAHLVLGLKMVSMSKDQFKRFFCAGTTGDALPAFARYDASAVVRVMVGGMHVHWGFELELSFKCGRDERTHRGISSSTCAPRYPPKGFRRKPRHYACKAVAVMARGLCYTSATSTTLGLRIDTSCNRPRNTSAKTERQELSSKRSTCEHRPFQAASKPT